MPRERWVAVGTYAPIGVMPSFGHLMSEGQLWLDRGGAVRVRAHRTMVTIYRDQAIAAGLCVRVGPLIDRQRWVLMYRNAEMGAVRHAA